LGWRPAGKGIANKGGARIDIQILQAFRVSKRLSKGRDLGGLTGKGKSDRRRGKGGNQLHTPD